MSLKTAQNSIDGDRNRLGRRDNGHRGRIRFRGSRDRRIFGDIHPILAIATTID